MNHVIAPRAESEEPVYRADFAMGEHSARHLRRILRLYLNGWGLVAEGDVLDEGGRGLVLVAAVADKWGVEVRRDGGGKTVWFECLAAAPGAGAGSVTPTVRPAPRP
ncbi:ATP-binding protein [Streptomyces sp. NBC_01285]|uniref:ATP-binding protein n=1 Tax=Streptomyces sp. NBC_01285 TaxID=2903813 RepID=UPI002251DB2E|nr:ATP-binding protein [Streptomyces sp. NBC_01285]MCX4772781.1 ATP-binding protein [Streptomyces sp. NBC_01285]